MSEEVVDLEVEESETELEFRELHADAQEQTQRLKALADKAEKDNKAELAGILRELSGTVMAMVTDVVATCGGTFRSVEERLDELQDQIDSDGAPTESFLLSGDAADYLAYFEQVERLLTGLRSVDGVSDEQKEIFDALLRMTADRVEFTKAVAAEPDDAEDEAELQEGEGVGDA